jgi:hypothetical protein
MGIYLDEVRAQIDRVQADKDRVNADRDAEVARLNTRLTNLRAVRDAIVADPELEQIVADLDALDIIALTKD